MRLADFYVPYKIQSVMIWRAVMQVVPCTKRRCAPNGQRELERRRLERERELRREPEQVERWQSGVLSKLLSFFCSTGRSFLL